MDNRLKALNDCLLNLADYAMQSEILERTKQTNVGLLGLCNKVEDISQLVTALAYFSLQPDAPTLSTQDRIGKDLYRESDQYRRLLELTRFKFLHQSIADCKIDEAPLFITAENIGTQSRPKQLRGKDVDIIENEDNERKDTGRSEAIYQQQRVWIEWKYYTTITPVSHVPSPIMLERVQKLVALLNSDDKPSALRLPTCIGFFDDTDNDSESFRFGLVFSKPAGSDPERKPISLIELFEVDSVPALNDRISLAKELANNVRYLHSVNWLHKGLRPHNILFHPDSDGNIDYKSPYLSGFDFARPDRQEEWTEATPVVPEFDIYRHPTIQRYRQGFKKTFDIYALGLLLLEIAVWKPLHKVLGIEDPTVTSGTVAFNIRDRLLNEPKFMRDVSASAGILLRDSSRACIRGGSAFGIKDVDDETANAVIAKLGQGFYEEVVKKLEGIKC